MLKRVSKESVLIVMEGRSLNPRAPTPLSSFVPSAPFPSRPFLGAERKGEFARRGERERQRETERKR